MKLQHHDEFKKILASYSVSDRAKKTLAELKLVLMVAPSSTGRNTMIRELLKTNKYKFIVSDTTRPPRVNDGVPEQNGVEYWFRSEEEILDDLKSGEFLEAAVIHNQQVSGISIRELEKAKNEAKIAITDIEVVGTDNVMHSKADAIAIFLLPPSFLEWQKRLNQRGKMSQAEVNNRMNSAKKELEAALAHDYYQFVVADTLTRTVPLVDRIASGYKDKAEQQRGVQIAKELLSELN